MFQYGVTAALEELPLSQPVTLRGSIEDLCNTAGEIGYDALELHIREPGRYDGGKIRKAADAAKLRIAAVANGMELTVGGLSLIDEDPERREAAIARVLEHADFAAELGAILIVGIMRGSIPRNAGRKACLARFTQSLERICEYAERKQVEVVLESILRYICNYLCGVAETMDFIRGLGCKNLSLHIDTHSMAVEEQNLVRSILYCRDKPLGYVHYSDNNRMYPGAGALDFRALTRALADIGYDKYITVECLPCPTPEESARRAFSYMKSIENIVLAERQYQQF
ncbi:MAG: sugar phosphate isomerase/epimerase [Treponema sp.]|jgi:sugar phosphate isomerase/epimerase|nr:sugar phosphate isomerase/epimerase [Treponema sp.]